MESAMNAPPQAAAGSSGASASVTRRNAALSGLTEGTGRVLLALLFCLSGVDRLGAHVALRPARFGLVDSVKVERTASSQVEDRQGIVPNRDRVTVANPETNILWRVGTDLMHRRRKRWVMSFERNEYSSLRLQYPGSIVTIERALLIENMH